MRTTNEAKKMNRTIPILVGLLAAALASAGAATARDYDGRRISPTHARYDDGRGVRAAYRADISIGRHGTVIDHHLGFVALAAAVVGGVHLAHAVDPYPDHFGSRYRHHENRVVYGTRVAPHRHHDRCGHHRSSWHRARHPVSRAHGHHRGHGRGNGHRNRNGHHGRRGHRGHH